MNRELSQLEREVYLYLIDFLTEHTYQPSVRDIAAKFSLKSTRTVSRVLQSLAEKGYIRRSSARSRGVHVEGLASGWALLPVPRYSSLAPSRPALREENRDGHLVLERRFLPNDGVFALLADAATAGGAEGVLRGDHLLVDPLSPAHNGALVLARVGRESMIRTINHRGSHTVLSSPLPENAELEMGPTSDFEIVGVLFGVFRAPAAVSGGLTPPRANAD